MDMHNKKIMLIKLQCLFLTHKNSLAAFIKPDNPGPHLPKHNANFTVKYSHL